MQIINSIFNLFSGLMKHSKKIDLKLLPSQGKFYKDDFEIKIKKADLEDIIDYEFNFDKENVFLIIESIKKIVKKNTEFSKSFVFEDIKSVDLIFLFFEIVKFTTKKKLKVPFVNTNTGKEEYIEFESRNFNYFDFSKYEFDEETKEILIEGYRFSLPSIGIESDLTQYLAKKLRENEKLEEKNYDFLFFTGNKNILSFEEIENLVIIFNSDLEEQEKDKIQKIVANFLKIVGYTLKVNGDIVEIKTKIDLQTIWKES